jgi:glyoxylase-like metal-dependent hydrolase (beta-lactamase superfamily II)
LFGDGSIVVLRTPAHTPGEMSLQVRSPICTVLTGDMCHSCMEDEHTMVADGVSIFDVCTVDPR